MTFMEVLRKKEESPAIAQDTQVVETKTTKTTNMLTTLLREYGKNKNSVRSRNYIKKLRGAGFFDRKNTSRIQDFLFHGKSISNNLKKLIVEPNATWDKENEDWTNYRMWPPSGKQQTSAKDIFNEIFELEGIGRTDVSQRKPIREGLTRYATLDMGEMIEKAEKVMESGEGEDFHYLFRRDYADDVLRGVYRITSKISYLYNELQQSVKNVGRTETRAVPTESPLVYEGKKGSNIGGDIRRRREMELEGYERPTEDKKVYVPDIHETPDKIRRSSIEEINKLLRVLEFLLTVNKLTGNADKLKSKNLEIVKKLRRVSRKPASKYGGAYGWKDFESFNPDTIDVTEASSKFPQLIAAWDAYDVSDEKPRQITIEGEKFPEGTPREDVEEQLVERMNAVINQLEGRVKRSKKPETIDALKTKILAVQKTLKEVKGVVKDVEPAKLKGVNRLRILIGEVKRELPNLDKDIDEKKWEIENLEKKKRATRIRELGLHWEDRIKSAKNDLHFLEQSINYSKTHADDLIEMLRGGVFESQEPYNEEVEEER